MGLVTAVFSGRDWLLDRVAQVDPTVVLNDRVASGDALAGVELAATLKQLMNRLQAKSFAHDGSTVNYQLLRESAPYAAYRACTRQLRTFDPQTLTSPQEKRAFWINLYNALVIDAVLALDVQVSVTEGWLGILRFFRQAAYNVGGQRVSLEDIEHGILRANRGNPYVPGSHFAPGDPRLNWALPDVDKRIHFALNCGSMSCPPVGVYTADRLTDQLDLAARNFVAQSTSYGVGTDRLCLSQIFRWYAADFGGQAEVLAFVLHHLPAGETRDRLAAQQSTVKLAYQRYDWSLNATMLHPV